MGKWMGRELMSGGGEEVGFCAGEGSSHGAGSGVLSSLGHMISGECRREMLGRVVGTQRDRVGKRTGC